MFGVNAARVGKFARAIQILIVIDRVGVAGIEVGGQFDFSSHARNLEYRITGFS